MSRYQIGSALLAIVGMATSTAFPFTIQTPAFARSTFYDVQGHWAQLCIEELARQGIFSGYQDASFRPNETITRGEFATIIRNAFPNAPAVSTDAPFFDVPSQTRTGTDIRAARQIGFVSGFPSGVFKPTDKLTRVQALVALSNGLNFQPTTVAISELYQIYDDAGAIPPFAISAIAAATQKSLVVNYPNIRLLNPNLPATRGELATFVCQALASSGKSSPVPPQYIVSPPNSRGVQTDLQTSANGQVQGQLTYNKQNYVYSDLRLKVVRAGETLLDTTLPVGGGVSSSVAFRVQDLDGDGEPEILVDLFTRGEGCCSYSLIYRYLPSAGQYSYIQHPWGYAGYKLKDFDGDGSPEFDSLDSRFGLRFASSYMQAAAPMQIWQYRQGQMFDVTRQYPTIVSENSSQLWQSYQERLSNGADVKPVLAAYLANQLLLGKGQEAWTLVQQSYEGGDRGEYIENLRSFLRSTGYYR